MKTVFLVMLLLPATLFAQKPVNATAYPDVNYEQLCKQRSAINEKGVMVESVFSRGIIDLPELHKLPPNEHAGLYYKQNQFNKFTPTQNLLLKNPYSNPVRKSETDISHL